MRETIFGKHVFFVFSGHGVSLLVVFGSFPLDLRWIPVYSDAAQGVACPGVKGASD